MFTFIDPVHVVQNIYDLNFKNFHSDNPITNRTQFIIEKILGFLDARDRSAFSRINKYIRLHSLPYLKTQGPSFFPFKENASQSTNISNFKNLTIMEYPNSSLGARKGLPKPNSDYLTRLLIPVIQTDTILK
jgi:hypothetical protein